MMTSDRFNLYQKQGFVSPVRVCSAVEALAYRQQLEDFEAKHAPIMSTAFRNKPHLVLKWVADLIRNEAILDLAEEILGPNLLVWGTNFFIKNPGDGTFISWHQDSTYWGLSRPDVMTIWVALSPSNRNSGAMKMVRGSHKLDQLPHTDTFETGNLLTRGQHVNFEVNEADVSYIELEPGEASLHHVRIVHGSEANLGADRRIGLAIRFVPTDVQQISGARDYATLVRGTDSFNYFHHEPIPEEDMGTKELKNHARISEESFKLLYRGTAKGPAIK